MTDRPITPPPELVQQWVAEANEYIEQEEYAFANLAAQWGADQELEACCEWLAGKVISERRYPELRAARRPKPPSLKEQAMVELDGIAAVFRMSHGGDLVCDKIRRALEALPND
jgi:hypothetical protein